MVVLFSLPLFSQSSGWGPSQPDSTRLSTLEEMERYGILTWEESQFTRADLFPLSLAQRGRLSASAYRGMPPGFLRYYFGGKELSNPFSGFYNEQWLPYYAIQGMREFPGSGRVWLLAQPTLANKPITRLIFSQDYVVNLSFLDVDFSQRLSRTNFIYLSGSNLLSDGSQQADYSKIHVNTYRGQLHWQLTSNWQTDLFYWQLRHRFNITPESGQFQRDKFKQVGHLLWARFRGKVGENDSLWILPEYNAFEDRFTRGHDNTRRNNHYTIASLTMDYAHRSSAGRWGIQGNGRWMKSAPQTNWFKRQETDGRVKVYLKNSSGKWQWNFEGGFYRHSESGQQVTGRIELGTILKKNNGLTLTVFSDAIPPPLLWRTLQVDTIPTYLNKTLIQQQGIAAALHWKLSSRFRIQLEPFVYQTRNYPLLTDNNSRWERRTIRNYGVRLFSTLDLKLLYIVNDFTYHRDYRHTYTPQVNNVTTLKSSLRLFKTLRMDGIFTWHYLGYFHQLTFQRLLNQYRVSDVETGPFYLANFRLQAHFREAIVFFIWENILSQDYSIIKDTQDDLLIFRLGVDWILFD